MNNLGAFGLGATLISLLENCSDNARLQLYFFCSDVRLKIKKSIEKLLINKSFKGKYEFIDFDPDKHFSHLRALQNDYTPYGRILIADFFSDGYFLYLDSDLLIETDVLQLEAISFEKYIIGAVGGTTFRFALEKNFYINTLKISENSISFNSGVLLIDVVKWKQNNVKDKLMEIGNKYPDELLSADQTLLNAFFSDNYFILPIKFNYPWYPPKKPDIKTDAVFHFVGSPKPWDWFGKKMHSGFAEWKKYDTKAWKLLRRQNKDAQLKRSWAIRKSYARLLKTKYFS